MQELLSKALTLDTGVEASKVQSLICVEEACLFDAGRASIKAVEAWRYAEGLSATSYAQAAHLQPTCVQQEVLGSGLLTHKAHLLSFSL